MPTYDEMSKPAFGIAAVWTLAADPALEPVEPHVVVPDGCVDLLARASLSSSGRIENVRIAAVGQSRTAQHVRLAAGDVFVGIRFTPGYGAHALGLTPADLRDRSVDSTELETAVRTDAAESERARTVAELRGTLTVAAMRALDRARLRSERDAVRRRRTAEGFERLEQADGGLAVDAVARALSIDERTLRRDFEAVIGLSPKRVARLLRLRAAIAVLGGPRPPSLANVAQLAGYADQAHMTRDFAELARTSPDSFKTRLSSA